MHHHKLGLMLIILGLIFYSGISGWWIFLGLFWIIPCFFRTIRSRRECAPPKRKNEEIALDADSKRRILSTGDGEFILIEDDAA